MSAQNIMFDTDKLTLQADVQTTIHVVDCSNDLGLLAEEIDASTGDLLGNFPQAFSHVGLINAAYEIDEARRRAG